ncbi:MAG: hypothetical protein ABSE16_06075 [Verrucomicrobiota bacterium]|jgi:glutamate-ammonia-ligase adenylyltransferase
MQKTRWEKCVKEAADPPRAKRSLEALAATSARPQLKRFAGEQMRVITALFSGSKALGELLVAHPDWLPLLEWERLKFPRRAQGFQREVSGWLKPKLAAHDYSGALEEMRRFKLREMLRIGARDLARLGDMAQITRELSDVADVCLDAVWQICLGQLTEKAGQPYHQNADGRWEPTRGCVLGLGKLGGQDLNYSSDVDLMFVYGEEGRVFREAPVGGEPPRSLLNNHQFFNKVAGAFAAEVGRVTENGFLYRVDLRLRPEGESGPLARSLESYENYYAQWGQTWERMMLIKARGVAGDEGLAAEFLETIQTFRYPPLLSADVLHDVAAVKDRLEREIVGEKNLERNVKLGRGGIREIEFVVQSLQILHAGREPFLQTAQTPAGLAKLAQYGLLTREEAAELDAAYRFLRDVEHRLQMEENQQIHTIPDDAAARLRLARLMGLNSAEQFDAERQRHSDNVRRVYDRLLKTELPKPTGAALPEEFDGARAEWISLLGRHSFREPEAALPRLKEFAEGPGYVHVSPRTTDLARQLIVKFLAHCPHDEKRGERPPRAQFSAPSRKTSAAPENSKYSDGLPPPKAGYEGVSSSARGGRAPQHSTLSDPDRVLTRLDSFIEAYGSRTALMEMWNSNPASFELLLWLFDRSEFLAETAIRTPDMVEDLVNGGRLGQQKTAPQILEDLRHGLGDEDQFLWLRRYHEVELMRLGLRDILGLADFEQNLMELSALADACLQYAVEVVMRKNQLRLPPFAVIGLGKLAGCEIDYGSDLDVVFVANAKAMELEKLQRLAVEVMELLSRQTAAGTVFQVDARLRPDGEKGLLVNTLAAYAEYYRKRAQLWEIQALTRTRPVAGDVKLGKEFQKLAAALTDFRSNAQTADWKKEIHRMRMRIESERTPRGQDELAIKTGRGGLMDAEFIAQVLCLEHGWQEANTLRALERGRAADVLPDAGKLIESYQRLRRVEGILRRWSYAGETVLPDDAPAYYRVSVRCGFARAGEFSKALAQWRRAIREIYLKVFQVQKEVVRRQKRGGKEW